MYALRVGSVTARVDRAADRIENVLSFEVAFEKRIQRRHRLEQLEKTVANPEDVVHRQVRVGRDAVSDLRFAANFPRSLYVLAQPFEQARLDDVGKDGPAVAPHRNFDFRYGHRLFHSAYPNPLLPNPLPL